MTGSSRIRLGAFALVTVAAFIMGGCSSATEPPSTSPDPAATEAPTASSGSASTEAPSAPSGPVEVWHDVEWQWISTTERTSEGVVAETVPNPGAYTIVFRSDGRLEGKADCNAFGGTYASESGFAITLGPMTAAYCGAESLDTRFIQLLGTVVAGGPDGVGGFALESAGGAQRMVFRDGGQAPVQ